MANASIACLLELLQEPQRPKARFFSLTMSDALVEGFQNGEAFRIDIGVTSKPPGMFVTGMAQSWRKNLVMQLAQVCNIRMKLCR